MKDGVICLSYSAQIPLIWVDNTAQNRRSVLRGRELVNKYILFKIWICLITTIFIKNTCVYILHTAQSGYLNENDKILAMYVLHLAYSTSGRIVIPDSYWLVCQTRRGLAVAHFILWPELCMVRKFCRLVAKGEKHVVCVLLHSMMRFD